MAIDFPATPTIGQQITVGASTWQWDGTAWNIVPVMQSAVASDLPPANPALGQLWWRSSNGKLYIWTDDGNSKQWVEAAAGGAAASPLWEPIKGGLLKGSGAASVIVTDLAPYIDLRMRFKGFIASATDQAFYMQFSTDNGQTFKGSASEYAEQLSENAGTTVTGLLTSSGVIALSGSFACVHAQHSIWLTNFNAVSQPTFFDVNGSVFRATGGLVKNSNVGYGVTGICNAFKIYGPTSFDYHLIIDGVRG